MAIDRIAFPTANQPVDNEDYRAILDVMQRLVVGDSKIGITNFDNSSLPLIKSNSTFTVRGGLFLTTGDVSISGSMATGDNYIYLSGIGNTLTPTWTQTAPTWDYQYNHYTNASNYYVLPIIVNKNGSVYTKYEVQDRFLKVAIDSDANQRYATRTDFYDYGSAYFNFDSKLTVTGTSWTEQQLYNAVVADYPVGTSIPCGGTYYAGLGYYNISAIQVKSDRLDVTVSGSLAFIWTGSYYAAKTTTLSLVKSFFSTGSSGLTGSSISMVI